MTRIIFFIIALLIISLPTAEAGGGWSQPQGKGFLKISEWWVVSDMHYTDAGLKDPNVTSGIYTSSIYAEYGFSDRLTGVLYLPFFSRAYQNNIVSGTTGDIITPGESIGGIGDTDLSIKYGLTKPGSGLAIAATLTLGLPLGNNAGGTQGNLQTGDGEFNQLIQIDAGTGFQLGNTPLYSNIYLGYNNRSQGFSDEIRYGWELGGRLLNQKLLATIRITGIESTRNGETAATINSTSIFSNNAEFTSFGLELGYNIGEKWGISASYSGAFRGALIYASPSYSVGVYTSF